MEIGNILKKQLAKPVSWNKLIDVNSDINSKIMENLPNKDIFLFRRALGLKSYSVDINKNKKILKKKQVNQLNIKKKYGKQ